MKPDETGAREVRGNRQDAALNPDARTGDSLGSLRVCLISADYPPNSGYGVGTFTHVLARGLADLGHDVTVVCQAGASEEAYREGQVAVHRVRSARVWYLRGARLYWRYAREVVGSLEWSAGVYQAIHRLAGSRGFDIVLAPENGAMAYHVSRQKPARLVITCHTPHKLFSFWNRSSNWVSQVIVTRLEAATMQRADYLVSPSASLLEYVRRSFGVPGERIEVIPNPVDTEVFTPAAPRDPPAIPLALFVGRLERRKGVYDLAQAIGLIARSGPDFRCVIIGRDAALPDGRSARAELSATLTRSGCLDRVRFIDHLDRPRLVEWYQRCDVAIVPSLHENCPYTVLEAMACGKPVVATEVGGIPEIIQDGVTGRLVPVEDPAQLAEAIRGLLGDRGARERLGANARRRIEQGYSREAIARRYGKLFHGIVAGR